VSDFGWPCYEGSGRNATFAAAGLTVCEDLYADPAATTAPWYAYPHGKTLSASDACTAVSSSAISGLAFEPARARSYPAAYDGALFLSDYARDCVWVMSRGANGLPDPATVRSFAAGAAGPVDLEIGPKGELYYADLDGGTIRRIVWTGRSGA
jgi:glucose/arabinose dehydrogenase